MKIAYIEASNQLDLTFPAPLAPVGCGYTLEPEQDADVVVHAAHEPFDPIERRDRWIDVVVIDRIPYSNGEHGGAWLDFYTNLFRAHLILCNTAVAQDLRDAGLAWALERCVSIDGIQCGPTPSVQLPLTAPVEWVACTDGGATETKLRDTLSAAVCTATGKRPSLLFEGPHVRPWVGVCFDPMVTPARANYLTNALDFVVFPRSAYERIGSQLDCRQFSPSLDAAWRIASTAEGNAVVQYASEAINVMMAETIEVISTFGKVRWKRPQSNTTLLDVVFHAINVRGMR